MANLQQKMRTAITTGGLSTAALTFICGWPISGALLFSVGVHVFSWSVAALIKHVKNSQKNHSNLLSSLADEPNQYTGQSYLETNLSSLTVNDGNYNQSKHLIKRRREIAMQSAKSSNNPVLVSSRIEPTEESIAATPIPPSASARLVSSHIRAVPTDPFHSPIAGIQSPVMTHNPFESSPSPSTYLPAAAAKLQSSSVATPSGNLVSTHIIPVQNSASPHPGKLVSSSIVPTGDSPHSKLK